MRKGGALLWPLVLLALVVLLSGAVGVWAFGADRAMRMAAAAASTVTVDGLYETPDAHRVRVLELEVSTTAIDSLNSDLPWSGDVAKNAVVLDHGIRYPARFRYRGLVASTHFLGNKKSFRLSMKKDNPFAPYRKLNFINPKSFNCVNVHMALWIVGRMGVPVPYADFAFVRINGTDQGLMEVLEQVDGEIERTRHLTSHEVPVFKGDFPPPIDKQLLTRRPLWRRAEHWEYTSDAEGSAAQAQLRALIGLLNDTSTWAIKHDSLPKLIDIDAYLRYHAALKVLDTQHIDNYHNQWLVQSPRSGLFYPVMWDPLLLFSPKDDPLYPINDALTFWLLRDPTWRLQRDRYVHDAAMAMLADSTFSKEMDAVLERIRPSVLADRNKNGVLSEAPQDVFPISDLHYAHSADRLKRELVAYWMELVGQFEVRNAVVTRDGTSITISFKGAGAVACQMQLPEGAVPVITVTSGEVSGGDGTWILHPALTHCDGAKADAFTDGRWYTPGEVEVTFTFTHGALPECTLTNAITHVPIQATR